MSVFYVLRQTDTSGQERHEYYNGVFRSALGVESMFPADNPFTAIRFPSENEAAVERDALAADSDFPHLAVVRVEINERVVT